MHVRDSYLDSVVSISVWFTQLVHTGGSCCGFLETIGVPHTPDFIADEVGALILNLALFIWVSVSGHP